MRVDYSHRPLVPCLLEGSTVAGASMAFGSLPCLAEGKTALEASAGMASGSLPYLSMGKIA